MAIGRVGGTVIVTKLKKLLAI
jgi:hypothetical protein